MEYLPDPAGVFESDCHRRVLGHLSPPGDKIAWALGPLFARLQGDIGVNFPDTGPLQAVLDDLVKDGHVEALDSDGLVVYRMSADGYEKLVGPAVPPESTDVREATINAATSVARSATKVG